ncbi:MAG: acyl-CoA dehydrogenase family protein [Chloroflexi bacterium]|nr:acyl-CoA dehydrogenase family protein [Chloroflexota bacterium]
MDFQFTPEQEAFRQEVREFLARELPPHWEGELEGRETEAGWDFSRQFTKKLAQRGWLTMAWPTEYGGQGRSPIEQTIFTEECSERQAPLGRSHLGVSVVGPSIFIYGNEEQKKKYLGAISRDEIVFCQGFSEPNAGSDLASLQTRAVEMGDYYLVNGQKIWTSGAHRADYCWLGARTDSEAPKHRGISTLIVDMKSPGISIRPLVNMADGHTFNEVFFDDVRVPADNLVGVKNRGWYQMATTLDFERSGIGGVVNARRNLEQFIALARDVRHNGKPLLQEARVRNCLADLHIELQVARWLAYRVAWMQSQGQVPNYQASQIRLFSTQLQQKVARAAMDLLGLYGQLVPGSKYAPLDGRVEKEFLFSYCYTIRGGTADIQRNIIALRGLGLPRSG